MVLPFTKSVPSEPSKYEKTTTQHQPVPNFSTYLEEQPMVKMNNPSAIEYIPMNEQVIPIPEKIDITLHSGVVKAFICIKPATKPDPATNTVPEAKLDTAIEPD